MRGPHNFHEQDQRVLAEMREEEEAKAAEAKKRAKDKARERIKKTPEERVFAAKEQCRQAGQRMCPRIAGQIDRETGKLIDQFSEELTGLEKEVTLIVWREFLSELDICVAERKLGK
jgi:hypothetical protein